MVIKWHVVAVLAKMDFSPDITGRLRHNTTSTQFLQSSSFDSFVKNFSNKMTDVAI